MKRVLIFAYYLYEGNMGAVRLRRLVRALPQFGYEPTVLTHPPAADLRTDLGLPGRLVEVDALDLAGAYRKLRSAKPAPAAAGAATAIEARDVRLTTFINRWFMVPDKQRPWLKPAVRRALEILRKTPHDLIFASLDPRTNLLAAGEVARKSGIPSVIEYRDLWTASPYYHLDHATALHRVLHRRLEKRVLQNATRVTSVCKGIAHYLKEQYGPQLRDEIAIHYNFFDPAEFPQPSRMRRAGEPMIISYVGSMYLSRNPFLFFQALQRFVKGRGITPAMLRFRWLGNLVGIDGIERELAALGLRDYIDFLGHVPHRVALQELVDSDVALVIQAPQDRVHVPGKLFEAMGACVPVLAIAPPCETTAIIDATRCGTHGPHEPDAICERLAECWTRHQNQQRWTFNEDAVSAYAMNTVVGKLAALFDETSRARA